MLDPKLQNQLRLELNAEAATLAKQIQELRRALEERNIEPDLAQRLSEKIVRARNRIDAVHAALQRMTDHHYGQCQRCGNLLTDSQLVQDPAARFCIQCDDTRTVHAREEAP